MQQDANAFVGEAANAPEQQTVPDEQVAMVSGELGRIAVERDERRAGACRMREQLPIEHVAARGHGVRRRTHEADSEPAHRPMIPG